MPEDLDLDFHQKIEKFFNTEDKIGTEMLSR